MCVASYVSPANQSLGVGPFCFCRVAQTSTNYKVIESTALIHRLKKS